MTSRLSAVPDTPPRALGMIRVSKERDDMLSPELQRTAVNDYCAARGYSIVRWLEAVDESASRARSPWWGRLDQAIEWVEAGEIDVIVVWKLSRAARHRKHWAIAIDRVEVAGGRLESATEQIDASTSTGRLARGMLAELAAWEADVKSEQWKETQARRRRLGLPHTGGPRFGYRYDRSFGYDPDPDIGPILAELYQRYIDGEGVAKLAGWLHRQRVPTIRGGKWDASQVLRQLDSGFAAGLLRIHAPTCTCKTRTLNGCHNAAFIRGAHEPLIDEATWQAFLRRRESWKRMPARTRRAVYRLSGLARCGHCQAILIPCSKPGHGKGYLYRCRNEMQNQSCRGIYIARTRVEAAVREWLIPIADEIDARATTMSARNAALIRAKVDCDRLAREINNLEASLTRLTVQLAQELIPESAYVAARNELQQQQVELTHQLAAAQAETVALGEAHGPLVTELLAGWDLLPNATVRDLLARLIRRVEVVRDENGKSRVLQPVPVWAAEAQSE
jgi:site-specific DNA recombinase